MGGVFSQWSRLVLTAMSATDLSPREYHARRDQERQTEREALRLEVLEKARSAIRRLAPAFPPIRAVYLFGSLLQPGWFHPDSDVDSAVDCDDIEAETPFARALEGELERYVDLRPREDAVARAVETSGEHVYEREALSSGNLFTP